MVTLTLSSYVRSPGESWLHINVVINWQLSKQGIRWQFTRFQMIAGSRLLFFKFISNMLCLCQYRPALLRFWFQTDLRRKNSASFFKIQARKTFSYHGHVLITLHVQSLWQVSSCIKFMQHLESCLLCLLPSRVFSYSWLVCLLGFWLRNASLVKAANPILDGIVFVFHLAGCVREL